MELRRVARETDTFQDVGRLYAIGELTRGHRWVRPATADNPEPSLDSPRWPPTFVPDEEISAAFDLVSNSDRASADDQGALARIYDELEAIQKRVEATATAQVAAAVKVPAV